MFHSLTLLKHRYINQLYEIMFGRKKIFFLLLLASCLVITFTYVLLSYTSEKQYKPLFQKIRNKSKLQLFTGIFSYITFLDRRNGIRASWLKDCQTYSQIAVCKFIIDGLDMNGKSISFEKQRQINEEDRHFKDIVVLESFAGHNFAYRFYKLMEWAYDRYDFDFFIRIDDDQFLCFDRLVYELPYRKKSPLIWGYMHCKESRVWIDEGFMIISRPLFDMLMNRYDTLLCHKWGDQAMAIWLVELQKSANIKFFGDSRIFHQVAAYSNIIKSKQDICHDYLSLHGTYSKEMVLFYKKYEKERNNNKQMYTIPPVTNTCRWSTKTFNTSLFPGKWFAIPKLCKNKPIWSNDNLLVGRERNHNITV